MKIHLAQTWLLIAVYRIFGKSRRGGRNRALPIQDDFLPSPSNCLTVPLGQRGLGQLLLCKGIVYDEIECRTHVRDIALKTSCGLTGISRRFEIEPVVWFEILCNIGVFILLMLLIREA